MKLAVEVLCRQDFNLITAEITLRFVILKLENHNKRLAFITIYFIEEMDHRAAN